MTVTSNETASAFPRVVCAYQSNRPGKTTGILVVRDEIGCSTRHIDFAQLDSFCAQHHPELFGANGDERVLDLDALPPTALTAFLDTQHSPCDAAARAIAVGHLADQHAFLGYSPAAQWTPGVGIMGKDGKFTVLPIDRDTQSQN